MDDASLNIIPVILAFSWIFSDKKIWMLLQSTSQFHSGHFCFLLNICWQKICKMLHHEYHSGQFCILLNIFWQKIWILFQSTSFRSFLLSLEYFLTKNMNGALLNIIPVIFAFSWIFSDKKNMDDALLNAIPVIFAFSWMFFDKKYGQCFTELYSGHFCGLNISHWHCLNQVNFCIFLRKI